MQQEVYIGHCQFELLINNDKDQVILKNSLVLHQYTHKMKRLLLFIVFIIIITQSFVLAQDKYFTLGVGYIYFGDGDHAGIVLCNKLEIPINKTFYGKTGIQTANSAEMREKYFYDRHNLFTLDNYYNIGIIPMKTNFLQLLISAGGIWRYRNEIVFVSSRTVYTASGKPLQMIENDYVKSFDIGYDFDISVRIKAYKKISAEIIGQYSGYNKGSGYYVIKIGISYNL